VSAIAAVSVTEAVKANPPNTVSTNSPEPPQLLKPQALSPQGVGVAKSSVIDALKSGEGASTQDLDEPIGNVDLVINFYFSKNGIQVETKSGDAVDRKTMAWNEIFD
jgi:hypothetical protein